MSRKSAKASGKFVLRLPSELHESLRRESSARNLSLNEWVKARLAGGSNSQCSVLDAILKTFGKRLEGVVLYGSTVRGENLNSSDIDLLLVLNSETALHRGLYSEWDSKVLPELGEKYSPQFVHPPKDFEQLSNLWLEVALDGEILQDSEGQLRRLVGKLRGLIAEGRYRRKLSHGHPYWMKVE